MEKEGSLKYAVYKKSPLVPSMFIFFAYVVSKNLYRPETVYSIS